MREDLKIDEGGLMTPVTFSSTEMMDFRVPAESPALAMKCYSQGEMPGVKLGIIEP
jgi:hypothetical protein